MVAACTGGSNRAVKLPPTGPQPTRDHHPKPRHQRELAGVRRDVPASGSSAEGTGDPVRPLSSAVTQRLLLFDLDGTLLTTSRAGMTAMAIAGQQLFGDGFHFEGVHFGGALDPHLFAAAAERAGIEASDANHRAFITAYEQALPATLLDLADRVQVLPGVLDLLGRLRNIDHATLGLLTGNYSRTGPLKLEAAGIDLQWFTIRAWGEEAPTRPELVPVARQRYRHATGQPIRPEHITVIGDTPRDVACAKAHGCRAVAVATGPFERESLEQTNADVVVNDLTETAAYWPVLDI